MDLHERGLATDVVIAKSRTEANDLWRLRHAISEAQKKEGASLKHDVSVPVSSVGDFLMAAEIAVQQQMPDKLAGRSNRHAETQLLGIDAAEEAGRRRPETDGLGQQRVELHATRLEAGRRAVREVVADIVDPELLSAQTGDGRIQCAYQCHWIKLL